MAVVNLRKFPDELHKKAKIRAIQEEISLRELVIKAVEQYLKTKVKVKK